jgi:hypothetical protein
MALGLGEVLAEIAKVQSRTFADWLESSMGIPKRTAYK